MKIFKVRLDLEYFSGFSLDNLQTLYVHQGLAQPQSQRMLGTASCPNKGIGTKNWFHKWHLKLNPRAVFLCAAIPTLHLPKINLFLVQITHPLQYYFLERKAPFYSALFSKQKKTKVGRNFKDREKQIWCASNHRCPSSPLGAHPANLLLAAPKSSFCLLTPKQRHPLAHSASTRCWSEELPCLIHCKYGKSRLYAQQCQRQPQPDQRDVNTGQPLCTTDCI